LGDKLLDYARMGVGYYIVYDPEGFISQTPLRIFARNSLRFVEMADTWLSQVGLGVTLWEGEYEGMPGLWLRWCDQQGVILATGQEALMRSQQLLEQERQRAEQEAQRAEQEAQRAKQEAQRAKQEAQRAEQEAQRASAAEQRAAALAAKLAALGIDPTSIE
jgi:hypothetical protein